MPLHEQSRRSLENLPVSAAECQKTATIMTQTLNTLKTLKKREGGSRPPPPKIALDIPGFSDKNSVVVPK